MKFAVGDRVKLNHKGLLEYKQAFPNIAKNGGTATVIFISTQDIVEVRFDYNNLTRHIYVSNIELLNSPVNVCQYCNTTITSNIFNCVVCKKDFRRCCDCNKFGITKCSMVCS